MKKLIIAAAVTSAIAVPAAAQVTVSGNVEATFTSVATGANQRITGVGLNAGDAQVVNTQFVRFNGKEDLGGGLAASFQLTKEFFTMTGVEDNAAQFEEMFVAISGPFGGIKAGKFNHASRDGYGNYRFFGDIGRIESDFRTINAETQNTLEYVTPTISGFSAHATRATGGAAGTRASASAAAPHTLTFGGQYRAGALNIAISSSTREAAAVRKESLTLASGSYNLGMAKIGLVYATHNNAAGTQDDTVTGGQIAVPVGNGLTLGAGAQSYSSDENGRSATNYQLMAQKDLSKRTALYVAYASSNNTGTGDFSSTPLAPDSAGAKSNGYGIALTHKF